MFPPGSTGVCHRYTPTSPTLYLSRFLSLASHIFFFSLYICFSLYLSLSLAFYLLLFISVTFSRSLSGPLYIYHFHPPSLSLSPSLALFISVSFSLLYCPSVYLSLSPPFLCLCLSVYLSLSLSACLSIPVSHAIQTAYFPPLGQ